MSREWSEALVCPRCWSELIVADDLSCPGCGRVGQLFRERFVDFGMGLGAAEQKIVEWPEDFVRALPEWAARLAAGEVAFDSDFGQALQRHGLARADGSLTRLGRGVRYNLDEYRWQKGRGGMDGLLELSDVGPTVRALDVGCGAGQTLRLLEPDRPVELFGVDVSGAALAFGWRRAETEGVQVTFTAASATALPFRPSSFDLVVTRVALNYMHQREALQEMIRVLRPGGFLFCRVEGIWHDFKMLRAARGLKAVACKLRDLGWGMTHALTGWQPTPGTSLHGGRAYASTRRLRRIVSQLDCGVIQAGDSPNGPIAFGHRTQLVIVARKAERPAEAGDGTGDRSGLLAARDSRPEWAETSQD